MTADVTQSRRGSVLRIGFKHEGHGTLVRSQVQQLSTIFDQVESDSGVRTILFTGETAPYFIKHYEVAELVSLAEYLSNRASQDSQTSGGTAEQELELHQVNQLTLRLEAMDKLSIAALNGSAQGGGLEFALACDFRFAIDDPTIAFGFPETSLGILPGAGGTQRLSRYVGLPKALEMVLTGVTLSPREALQLGLVNRVLPAQGFEQAVQAFAEALAKNPAYAMTAAKQAVRRGEQIADLPEALLMEQALFNSCAGKAETLEIMRAYLAADDLPDRAIPLPGEGPAETT